MEISRPLAQLSDRLLASLQKLRGQSQITEQSIQEAIREIRLGLLEADVNYQVVKQFIDGVKEKALGQNLIKGVTAGQQFSKVVHDELVRVVGETAVPLELKGTPAVIFLVGLQGAGKTTTAAKLARFIREKLKKKVGLVPADVYRPAAVAQLQTLGGRIDAPVFPSVPTDRPEDILERSKLWSATNVLDVVIVDTAGRNQIDEPLMEELGRLRAIWSPCEVLLVADAMLGQQSVQVAQGFHERLGLTGLVLTKLDGDARGGAALSVRMAVGVPIKFLGVGEKTEALEVFHPDRLVSRILDLGDVASLVEKAQELVSEEEALASAKKMATSQFTVEDFLKQLQMVKKMGGMGSILGMLPGMGQISKQLEEAGPPEAELKRIEAMIRSMTLEERRNHRILNGSRRLRIAKGSGTQVSDFNKFIKKFEESQKMISQMMKMGLGGGGNPFSRRPMMPQPPSGGGRHGGRKRWGGRPF